MKKPQDTQFPPLYDWVSWLDKYSKPKNPDSLDEIVKELGIRVLAPGDFYQI